VYATVRGINANLVIAAPESQEGVARAHTRTGQIGKLAKREPLVPADLPAVRATKRAVL